MAGMIHGADRAFKQRVGVLAYAIAGLQTLQAETHESVFRIELDQGSLEISGVACIVANAGNLAVPGLSLSPKIDMSDGLLDVIVIRRIDVPMLLEVAGSAMNLIDLGGVLPHWQTRSVQVSADPVRPIAIDGEPFGPTPITACVIPAAVQIIVPRIPQIAHRTEDSRLYELEGIGL